jgi:molybdopterin molybdotransferase
MTLVPLSEAQEHVLAAVTPLSSVETELDSAVGMIMAAEIVAREAVSPFVSSAMDGYAVRAADTTHPPVKLKIVGSVAAGHPSGMSVDAGHAIRIMTGGEMPAGADAVVLVERTRTDGDSVTIEIAVAPGTSVRAAGEDIQIGDVIVRAGTQLTPARIGVLASVGVGRVMVYRTPRVGVLSTGDELVTSGPLRPGQIRDSNRHMLLALVRDAGFEALDLGIVGDSEHTIGEAIEHGVATCDAVLTTGGVSMGDRDYVKVVLDHLGQMRWMQIAIKPAKPLAFGTVGHVPIFGLPGNPVSSMVSFELFARPALRRMGGHTELYRPMVNAVASEGIRRKRDGKTHFVRVIATHDQQGSWAIRSAGHQGSHQLAALAAANALAVVADSDGLLPGLAVPTILLS